MTNHDTVAIRENAKLIEALVRFQHNCALAEYFQGKSSLETDVGVIFSYHQEITYHSISRPESKDAKLFGRNRAVEGVLCQASETLMKGSFSDGKCFGIGNAFC